MSYFTDIFSSMPQLGERLMGSDMFTQFYTIIFGVLLVLGILNCVFGYRLIRFWMMVGGFFVGAVLAFICVRSMDIQDKTVWGAAVLVTGIIFAVIAFLIYKAGVFLLAAGIGWALSIYFIHRDRAWHPGSEVLQGGADRCHKSDRWSDRRGLPEQAGRSG